MHRSKTRHQALQARTVAASLVLITILFVLTAACGVESGDRRPARQGETETLEFHRTPVTAFEQFRMDLTKDDASCSVEPSEVTVQMGQRVRLAIQLPLAEISQGTTGSLVVSGEKKTLQFNIEGLEMTASGGAFGTGKTQFDMEIESGSRRSFDFNPATTGAFDILCDDSKIGTFTVNPSG